MTEMTKYLILIGIMIIGNFTLYYLFLTAPIETKNQLENDLSIFKPIIIIVYNLSLFTAEYGLLFKKENPKNE
jgi:hypothetical protein